MSTIEQLTTDLQTADRALREINAEMEAAVRAAAEKVREEYRDRRVAASTVLNDATRALDDAKVLKARENNLVGQKVVKTTRKYVDRWSRKSVEVSAYGVLEIRTSQTNFPINMRYGFPPIGTIFVRLLKKDGTPGSKIDSYYGNGNDGWQIVEGE